MTKDYKNILIIKPSALGDIAISLPVLSSLRSSFPEAKISWMVRREFAPFLEDVTGLDEIILFDRKRLASWWIKPSIFKELMQFLKDLRSRGFDLVIDMQGLFRTAFFAWMTGCSKRYGMSIAREGATLLYTDSVAPAANSIHVIDYSFKILEAIGVEHKKVIYNLFVSESADEKISKLLNDSKIGQKDFVVFVTGSARDNKCWPKSNFAQLAKKINHELNLQVATVGSAAEYECNQEIMKMSGDGITDFSGKTDIRELTAFLNRAKLVVSNDTGPGHIAVALGRDVVMIFGPTNPGRIRPYGIPDSVVAINPDGRGKEINDYRDEYSIDKVTVDMVYDAVSKKLT